MIIDVHAHLLNYTGYDHLLAQSAKQSGIAKMVLTGGPRQYEFASNDDVITASERYPDLFIPFAHFRLGHDYPAMVDEFHARGFCGLQFTMPEKDYDDKEYYLVYSRAGQLGMPALFQLGMIPNSGRDHLYNVCCERMRPIYLDTIARAFPELNIIGTRLGAPWYEEACEVARCNPNVFMDLSGSTLRRKRADFFGELLAWDTWEDGALPRGQRPWHKILFGSDVHCRHLNSIIGEYQKFFEHLGLNAETRSCVMGFNAVRALNLELETAD